MQTIFKPLYQMAEGVRHLLEDTGKFKHTAVAAISTGGQIWASKDLLNLLPVAIVCVGSAAFESRNMVRNTSVLIIIIDEFKSGTEAQAGGIWPLLDTVCGLFVVELAGVVYEVQKFSPIESGERVVAFGIELNAGEAAYQETVDE